MICLFWLCLIVAGIDALLGEAREQSAVAQETPVSDQWLILWERSA